MLSGSEFIKQSLGLHLFFLRIMKEHAFFLEASFTKKNANLARQADSLKVRLEALLQNVVTLSNGVVEPGVLLSGEVITPYTLSAEVATQNFTGIRLATGITRQEMSLTGSESMMPNPILERKVVMLNRSVMALVTELISFKKMVLNEVLSCMIYTTNYPLLIEHILREAEFYMEMLRKLQNREDINSDKLALENEIFWNNIMGEHAEFIRGLLDPTEEVLMKTANNFAIQFKELTNEAKEALDKTIPMKKVTDDSLAATQKIKEFKAAGDQALLNCKIRSIIVPLLADHVLREANHYLRLLRMYEKEMPKAEPVKSELVENAENAE